MFGFLFYALFSVYSSFAIILKKKEELVYLLLLSYICIITVNVLWLFLTAPWVALQCVITTRHTRTSILWRFSCVVMPNFSD